jgi:hypothetical protein
MLNQAFTAISPTAIRDFIQQKLNSLDFGAIAFKLMHPKEGEGWTKEQVNRAIAKYAMFLCLIALYPGLRIIPSREIDRVWHHHLSDTQKYAEDCQKLFGCFIHHSPYAGLRGEEDEQSWSGAFEHTKVLLEYHFGTGALGDVHSQAPAACEPLREFKQNRPSVDLKVNDTLQAYLDEIGMS